MNLKELRIKNKLTQQEVANLLKTNRVNYNRYELEKGEPDIKTLIKLADIYNVSIDELIGRDFNLLLNEQEKELIEKTKSLTAIEIGKVIGYIDNMLKYKQETKRQAFYNDLTKKINEDKE